MNNTLVQWANEVKHHSNILQSSLSNDGDCRFKRSMFIGYVNRLISKFGHLQPDVLINLFNTYCCFSMDRVCSTCIRLVSKAVSQPGILVHERYKYSV